MDVGKQKTSLSQVGVQTRSCGSSAPMPCRSSPRPNLTRPFSRKVEGRDRCADGKRRWMIEGGAEETEKEK